MDIKDAHYDLIITMESLVTAGETTQRVHMGVPLPIAITLLKHAFSRGRSLAPIHVELVAYDPRNPTERHPLSVQARDRAGATLNG
jgi:hypothetical protein